jgi:ABC-type sugar transport system permease subunit
MATLHTTHSVTLLPGAARRVESAGRGRTNKFLPLWLLLPTILILLAVQIYPTLYSFYLSLNQTKGGELIFVGLENYLRLFRDIEFGRSLGRTFVYAGSYLVLTVVLGLGLAILLNRRVKFTGFYLVLLFIPWVISDVVAGTIWRWMFQQSYGILQYWLGFISERSLFINPNGAMGIVVVASVWRSLAFTIILFLGALQTIPGEVLESAALDGATGWQSFWNISFPLIRPTFLVAILLTSIRGINSLGMILSIMGTTGGTGNATQTTALYMLNAVQRDGDFGLAASTSVIMFLLNLVLTFVYLRFVTRKGD